MDETQSLRNKPHNSQMGIKNLWSMWIISLKQYPLLVQGYHVKESHGESLSSRTDKEPSKFALNYTLGRYLNFTNFIDLDYT